MTRNAPLAAPPRNRYVTTKMLYTFAFRLLWQLSRKATKIEILIDCTSESLYYDTKGNEGGSRGCVKRHAGRFASLPKLSNGRRGRNGNS